MLIRRSLIHSGVTERNEILLFTAALEFDQFKLGEEGWCNCKTGRMYVCLLYLFIPINPLRCLIIIIICLSWIVFMTMCVSHLQPPGPSEWKPARHVSHFFPVTPFLHAHPPSTSHCRLSEPDSRWIRRKKEKLKGYTETRKGSIFKKMVVGGT